ncbi:MAG: hypothetical protein ABI904_03260 [Chloroflexota bacterium]
MTIYGLNMDGLGTDTRAAKLKRAAVGALYGFLGGAAFVVMAAYINILLNPDLPYGVDWSTWLARLPFIVFGLALVGAVTCWWHEAWQGLVGGSAVAAILALIVSLFSSEVTTGLKFVVGVFILVPIAAMTLPVAYLLRLVTERHAAALHAQWSTARIAGLLIIVLALGAGCGYFTKTSPHGVDVARFMNSMLQNPTQKKNPLGNIEGVLARQASAYKLYQQKSTGSTEGYIFRVEYADGFTLRCNVIAYPGTDPFITTCETDQ